MRANLRTKPPKHMKKGNGKPGQKFSLTRMEALSEKYGVDPAEESFKGLIEELSPGLTQSERINIALKLMEYTYAKRKAVEVSGPEGEPVRFVIEK